MVGRVDCLHQRSTDHPKARKLDLSALLAEPAGDQRIKTEAQTHEVSEALDHELIAAAEPAIEGGQPVVVDGEMATSTARSARCCPTASPSSTARRGWPRTASPSSSTASPASRSARSSRRA
jgi:hypothetical protein